MSTVIERADGQQVEYQTVQDHHTFVANEPETFDWSLVWSEKHRTMATLLQERTSRARRAQEYDLVLGLREALRLLATQAMWKVSAAKPAARR